MEVLHRRYIETQNFFFVARKKIENDVVVLNNNQIQQKQLQSNSNYNANAGKLIWGSKSQRDRV